MKSRKDAEAQRGWLEMNLWGNRQGKLSLYVFLLLIFNLVLSPVVRASVGGTLSRGQSYSLSLLGLVVFSLFIYLFMVIFQPEKF